MRMTFEEHKQHEKQRTAESMMVLRRVIRRLAGSRDQATVEIKFEWNRANRSYLHRS